MFVHSSSLKPELVAASISKPLPHYKLGDLGLVPRPGQIAKQRHGVISASSLGPPGAKTRSIGVQTVSAQKVGDTFFYRVVILVFIAKVFCQIAVLTMYL